MESSNTSSTTKPSPIARRSRWPRVVMCLLMLFVGWMGWKFFGPQPDLSSSITIGETADDQSNTDAPPEGSLLSRVDNSAIEMAKHPLDPLLAVAEKGLVHTDQVVVDYTARIVSQVRLNGKLQPEQQMDCKIRHARTTGDDLCGFSVYLKFVAPNSSAGQEVIWVDGWNDGNLVAHLTGWQNVVRTRERPTKS